MTARIVKCFLFLLTVTGYQLAIAQPAFRGTFLMTLHSSVERNKADAPMLWNIDSSKMVMEIQDEMKSKGVSKRVLFDMTDSTWTMIMQFNDVKQATRMHAAAMYRDTVKHPPAKLTATGQKRIIDGLHCKKMIVENSEYHDEIWVTGDIRFNLCRIYKMLSHCGMMSDFLRNGEWFHMDKKITGMVMEVTSLKKATGEIYTLNISGVVYNKIDKSLFNLKGFKISEIPEGQSCGPTVTGK